MKTIVRAPAQDGTVDDGLDLLTTRYKAALDKYRMIVERNTEICRNGGHTSAQSLANEERALETLDCARERLLVAVEHAYPTIH